MSSPSVEIEPAQLGLFPVPRVAIELFPFAYFVNGVGDVQRGCHRACVRGLGVGLGEGPTVDDALSSLAGILHVLSRERQESPDVTSPDSWVWLAAQQLDVDELARWLHQWAEEPRLAEHLAGT